MERSRLAYATAVVVGAGTAVALVWWFWTRRQKEQPPKKWRKVGELSDLIVFPVKSLGAVRLNTMECTPLGLRDGWLRDRTLMVIDMDGHFVTGRQLPRMVQVSPSISGSTLTLRAPGMMAVSVDLAGLRGKGFRAAVWGQPVPARDCGEEAARWLSRFLLQEDTGLRLVYYPLDRPTRDVRTKNKPFPLVVSEDTGAYPDATSYTLMNEASIADLNTRLEDPVTPQHFRPNFVVKGAQVLEEDSWDWVKIGNVVFRNVKPCTRCIFTTVDPETGMKSPKVEPLKTLKGYRQIKDPELRPFTGDSPVMGIHLGLRSNNGNVRLGDGVFVGVPEEEEPFYSPPLLHRWSSCEHDVFPIEEKMSKADIDYPDSSSSFFGSAANIIASLSNLE
ncbi:mitochondrial amidoxime reducing component 2 isoform X2 [Neodiprion virginianus]|uniref:mitochondrial amidoxime reducing component 2 n=1 Tax=Neodiprion fabricii TaxID=2872261 RepID=UPI001ED97D0C|nr:mitochondrial amidoxime reducing component 2 [Neodiprion fabricii]XP_046615832.1 mitochondrial amidoxime reducing component 2 isoform X1 [Neodiprion virginianus]XP_046615833.1 mitochondrial amidoxime reducing component 2 isoform X2 [Neodiprion virginianus]